MAKVAILALALALAGCASKPPPRLSKLPALVPYTQAQKAAINAERPRVKACCPNTDKAMESYGKLRSKIEAAKALEAGH